MAKKSFDFNPTPKSVDKPKVSSVLSMLSKDEREGIDIAEISKELNDQIISKLIDTFGEKWKYRTQKEVLELTNTKLQYSQLKQFSLGKSFSQENILALLFLIAKHSKNGIQLEIKGNSLEIKQ